jgi:formate/nitrite transporter
MLRTPKETYDYTVKLAEHKGHYGVFRQFILALAAGTYVGIGVTVIMLVGGGLSPELRAKEPGLFLFLYSTFGFPTALTLIVLTGTDLFTSTVAYMAFGLMERRVAPVNALRSVILSWWGNFLGCLFIMGIMAGAQVFNGRDMYLVYAAERKVLHYGWGTLIAKGVLCNWFVNLAVWQSNAANDLISKFIGILLPISAFVVTNGEHCVANMFLLTIAKHHHAEYTLSQMFHRNLVPVTIGNILGGVIMISLPFFLAYGSLGEFIQEYEIDHIWKRLEAHDHRHEPLNVVTISVHPDPPAGVKDRKSVSGRFSAIEPMPDTERLPSIYEATIPSAPP